MMLTKREITLIAISQAISQYSMMMQEDKIPEYGSVIDFVLKNIPEEYRKELTMELIDDVFAFVSRYYELS